MNERPWPILRLLLTTHSWVVLFAWLAVVVLSVLFTVVAAVLGDVTTSVWAGATTVLRWVAIGYGWHLIARVLPIHVANGRTRRESLTQISIFLVVASGLASALVTLGYWLEGLAYRALGWPQAVGDDRLFDLPDQYGLILLSYWVLLLLWTTAGALLAAGVKNDVAPLGIAAMLGLIALAGLAAGFAGVPFVGTVIASATLPPLGTAAVGVGGYLAAVGVLWLLARDLPVPVQ